MKEGDVGLAALPQADEQKKKRPIDPDFKSSGLLTRSLIRLGFLSVVTRKEMAGAIGSISPERHRRLLRNLSDAAQWLRYAPPLSNCAAQRSKYVAQLRNCSP
jgi:hypothetical protein